MTRIILGQSAAREAPALGGMRLHCMFHAGFYAMTSFHLLARDRPSIFKPFEIAAFMGFFAW